MKLSPGKSHAKAGQAFINAFAVSPPEIQCRYLADGEGTQVSMHASDEVALRRAILHARAASIPVHEVVEGGVLVAAGLGPCTRAAAKQAVRGLRCM